MTTTATPPVTQTPTAATFDGLYLRPSLQSTGVVPATGEFCMCPDIIATSAPVADPVAQFSTIPSWGTMYATDPTPGEPTYYYVRGLDGATTAVAGTMSLYWAPAQLIMFPSTWKVNELPPSGATGVTYTAASGQIGVGGQPFVWQRPPVLPDPNQYVAFVAMATAAGEPVAPPSVASWLDMSALLTQSLDLGLRNTSHVDASAESWTRRVELDVPASIPTGAQLTLTIASSGFAGTTVGLLADEFGADRRPMMISPTLIGTGSFTTGIVIAVEPGMQTSFALQAWSGSGPAPVSGSTLTLSVDYAIPPNEQEEANRRVLVDPSRSAFLATAVGVGPTAMAPLGSAVFIAE